ncbi:MAG: hypothetical protein L0191_04800, partial [Acidobacteria bacterium]|nr:hypothetical protein [Acidobacteriota bacterium]
ARAGAAALAQGRRGTALTYLARSLGHELWQGDSWKWLAKTLMMPARRSAGRGTSGTEETM